MFSVQYSLRFIVFLCCFTLPSISLMLILGRLKSFSILFGRIFTQSHLEQHSPLQILVMKAKKKSGLQEYDQLLVQLKEFGRYQVRLMMIMVVFWFLSGLNEGIFQINIAEYENQVEFYVAESLQFAGVIVFTYLSLIFNRYKVNILIIILLLIGGILVTIGQNDGCDPSNITCHIGIAIVVSIHYTLAFNILMVNIEFHRNANYPIIWMFAYLGLVLGRIVAVAVSSSEPNGKDLAYKVVLPGSIIYIFASFFYFQSPRFLIDQQFQKAQELTKSICQVNNVKQQTIGQIMQRQFYWNKVNLQRYSLLTLYKYESISANTYFLVVSSLLLGIICRCPDFIQHLQIKTPFQVEDSVEIVWESVFQVFGLLTAYAASHVLKRRLVGLVLSIILLITSGLLALLLLCSFSIGDSVLYSMAILGLNSFFSVALFYFIILMTIELYPHTIRTLACGLIMASEKFGRVLFSLHIEFVKQNTVLLELVLCCSVFLILHIWFIQETFKIEGRYQILEIQQKENGDY